MEERLVLLEKEMNLQAFQIKLLHAIIQEKEKAGIYELIVQMSISEQAFNSLKRLTSRYEEELNDGFHQTLSSYIQDVQRIFDHEDQLNHFQDLSHFIPRWLGGVNGRSGFSPALHKHFYM